MDQNNIPQGVSSDASKLIFRAYATFNANGPSILRQDYNNLQTNRNKHPLEPRQPGVPTILSKMIPEPMVCLDQTMHLSCTDTNTVSKWNETRFDMTHIT
jgi:hypothetical protein